MLDIFYTGDPTSHNSHVLHRHGGYLPGGEPGFEGQEDLFQRFGVGEFVSPGTSPAAAGGYSYVDVYYRDRGTSSSHV
jgi:hypothetical protein